MLSKENTKEQVADDQMDVDALPTGSAIGATVDEDRLSSEFQHRLGCEFQENPGSLSAGSGSSLASDISFTGDEIVEKAIFFVQTFVREFEEKLSQSYEEVKPGSKMKKTGKAVDKVASAVSNYIPPSPLKLVLKEASDRVGSFVAGKHKGREKKFYATVVPFKDKKREILVNASLEVFQKFEQQFTQVVDVYPLSWERGIWKLAIDAVSRAREHILNINEAEFSVDLVTQGVVLGQSKESFPISYSKDQMEDEEFREASSTSLLYKKVGIKIIEGNTAEYYRLKEDNFGEKYGYRLLFAWESENWEEIKGKYVLSETPEEEYESILDNERKEKLASFILKEINGEDHAKKKNMEVIENHLRRQDEDRSQFSYSFNELAKFFIEREKVIKELNLKLHSKSQEIEMSRIVLIHGKPGVGKTEFVKGYGFSGRRKGTWDKIMWIDALNHSSLKNSFIELAKKLEIPTKIESGRRGERDRDIESIVKDVYERLQYTKSFFVFDRAPSYEEIKKFLPANFPLFLNKEKPFIVITCENDWQEEGMEKVKLGGFDPKESDEFLREALGEGTPQDDISKLGKTLNYHPFLLAQAAANISQGGDIHSCLKRYKTMQQLSRLQDDDGKSFGILKINIDKIKEEKNIGPQSYAMLEFMAYLNSYPINIKEIFFPGKSKENQKKIWYALGRLNSYSLIHLKKGIAQIHQTTQEFMRLRQKEEGKEEETLRKIIILLRNSNTTTKSHIVSVWNHVSKYKGLVNDFVNLSYHKGYNILHLLAKDGNEEVIRLILEKIGQDKLSEVINTTDRIGLTPLYYAIIDDNLEVVKYLVKKGAELIVNGEYSINHAVMYGSLKVVKYFIDNECFEINDLDGICEGCLSYAIKYDRLSIIKYLIGEKVAADELDDDEVMHLFYYAFEPGNLDIAQYLVRNLDGMNLCDEGGKGLLHYTATYGSLDIVEYLVENGANVNLPDHDGKSPLYYAVMSSDLDVIKYLVENDANVNLPDHDGKSPLYYAVASGDLDIVKYLVQNGANVNLRDENIITLLFCAVEDGILTVVECLLEIGVDINQCDKYHLRPLYYAAAYGHLDIVKYLVQNGANVNLRDENIITLLFCAVKDGNLKTVECLVEIGVDINQCNTDHISPLHYAAEKGRLNVVKFLIGRKANLNLQNKKGESPLHYAIQANHFNTARYLLMKGASIDLADKDNHNPLYFTTFNNMLAILYPSRQEIDVTLFNNGISFLSLSNVKFLIERGVNVNQYNEYDMNLLHYATRNGHLNIVEYLIGNRANVNACGGRDEVKPLHYAAMYGYLNIVEKLIEEGANVNACDKYGASPLHYAARVGHLNVVIHLVNSKANINLLDEYSKKPLHYSIENNHLNIANYLRVQEDNVNPAHEQSQRKRPRVSELQDCTLPYSVNGQCVSSKRRKLENVRATSLDNQEAVNPLLDTTTSLIALKFKLQHVLSSHNDKMQRFTQLRNNDSGEPQQPVDNSVPISSLSGIVIEPGNNKVSVQPSGIRDDKLLYCFH